LSRLEVTATSKRFGPTVALDGVDLCAEAGEIHAVLGENGAGKSTLMAILSGATAPDAGAMKIDGEDFAPRSPLEARAAGVAIVHQELSLCPHLTVADNVLLGSEPVRLGLLSGAESKRRVRDALDLLQVELNVDATVASLSPANRQLVEILRAIALGSSRVLILDEPTSSLGAEDVGRLFELVRRLADRGTTVLYISHFLEEVFELADGYTVLRDGRTVGTGKVAETDVDHVVRLMVGRPVERMFVRSEREVGSVVLEVSRLSGAEKPVDASLSLRRGEVLGLFGLVGAGRTELVRAIFGLDPVRRGKVRVGVHVGPASPTRRLAQGVGFVSEDRKGEGLLLSMSIADNLTLSRLPLEKGLLLPGRQLAAAQRWIERLSIRCHDAEQPVSSLSGGNQQKVALGRLLHHDVDVLLLDEPTRGIDVGSKAQIYELIDELAESGKSVLLVSSYLPELLGVCDRIMVMQRGHLGPPHDARTLTEHAVLTEATGAA